MKISPKISLEEKKIVFSPTSNITQQTRAIESKKADRDIHYYALKAQMCESSGAQDTQEDTRPTNQNYSNYFARNMIR